MENLSRHTYIEVDLGAIKRNVRKIINLYNDYKYRVAIVKGDCYGHRSNNVIKAIIDAGANYLGVSMFCEAMEIRKDFKDIPIFLLVPPPIDVIDDCIANNISITVADQNYISQILDKPIKVHLRVDCGYDFYNGPSNSKEFDETINIIKNSKLTLECIYMHNYHPTDLSVGNKEFENFENMTKNFDLSNVSMISIPNSLALVRYEKKNYANAFRMGNLMYGIENESLSLEDTFKLYSKVISIKTLNINEKNGYNTNFIAQNSNTKIAMIPIGYADGFAKANIGNFVFINDRKYKILHVSMDITSILIDDTVNINDTCILINGDRHLDEIAEHNNSIAEEPLCILNKRVPIIYKDK